MKQGENHSLPKGWEQKKLGEVCEFKSGTTISNKLEKVEGDIIYAKVGDMNLEGNEENITVSTRYVDSKEINKNQIIPVGSIIFPKRGGAIATNKKRRIIKPTIVDLNTMALVPNKIIDKQYLYFWFHQIDLSELSNGTSIPQINNYSFDNIFISFPKSLPLQQRIVAILDEAFTAIAKAKANAEQNLKNAKEIFKSYLQGVFENKGEGWVKKKLGDACEIINRGISPNYSEGQGLIVLNQKCVRDHKINFDKSRIHDISGKKVSQDKMIKLGDVLINSTGTGTLGRVAQVRNKIENVIVDSHITIVRPLQHLFFYDFFGWALIHIEDEIAKKGEGCGGQTELSRNTLANDFYICFPESISTQQSFVVKLNSLSAETKKLESIYQKRIDDLEELKKSILHKAFR